MRRGSIVQLVLLGAFFGAGATLVALLIPWLPPVASKERHRIDIVFWFTTAICIGVFGVAILAAIFARYGGYRTPEAFVDGFRPALWVGAGFVAAGALAALAIPGRRRPRLGGAVATPA